MNLGKTYRTIFIILLLSLFASQAWGQDAGQSDPKQKTKQKNLAVIIEAGKTYFYRLYL